MVVTPTGVALLIVMLRVAVALCAVGVCESVTTTVKLVVPRAVGVPVIAPPELRLSPAGKLLPACSAQV